MTSLSDWSLDYCLTCDKQTTEGLYCSQACRHADFDNIKPSTTSTPTASLRSTSSWSGFVLPPAFDFASSRLKSKTVCNSPVNEFKPPFEASETKRSSVSSFAESTTSTPSWQGEPISTRDYLQQQPSHCNITLSQESKEELQRYEGLFVKSRRHMHHYHNPPHHHHRQQDS